MFLFSKTRAKITKCKPFASKLGFEHCEGIDNYKKGRGLVAMWRAPSKLNVEIIQKNSHHCLC